MINLTDNAIEKLKDILSEDPDIANKFRISIQGGGCSGMSYGFSLDTDVNEDDFTFDFSGVGVLIDSMSSQYMQGATIDYKEDLSGSSFVISNPNAETTCGCGSSFSV